ncbi:hypothetical protein BDA96_10G244000 [Sorghum bicolor]|uniref:Uncharacterized protein n=2 Tax=Sorghum bicolor TaxID=4558 RepID=A0A921Q6F7_SORBI|nr:hypothetical protein BDA96_10G244000 [Sorghum bicolor]OQU76679.1 hypothetical protein SORBI_3010G185850 [Sorghum bicolor]
MVSRSGPHCSHARARMMWSSSAQLSKGWSLISWRRQPSLTFGGLERLLIWARTVIHSSTVFLPLYDSNPKHLYYSFVCLLSTTLRGCWQ